MTRPGRIVLPADLLDGMIAHAQAELPLECCGVFGGRLEDGTLHLVRRYPLVNALASPTEFESDPRGMFDAVRDMRLCDLELVGCYHSHPTSAPVPSKVDLARCLDDTLVHFIVGLASDSPIVRAWWLTSSAASETAWSTV